MNKIEIKEPFTIHNPYRAFSFASNPLPGCYVPKFAPQPQEQGKLLALADRVVDWGKSLLFQDYEKQVDFVGLSARILDWGVFVAVGGMEATVLVNGLFHLTILENKPFSDLPGLIKLVAIPAAIFSFILGTIQMILEILHLQRAAELLSNIEDHIHNPLEALEWVKSRYFTIEPGETEKIYNFIEMKLPTLDNNAKAIYFDQIAQKALEVKFESLKRRITPGLAEEVKTQMNSIMNGLRSFWPSVRAEAEARAEVLMASITKQAKIRIVVHLIGIIAIALTLISLAVLFAGSGTFLFFVTIGAISTALMLLQFAIQKGYVDRGAVNFYDTLKELELRTIKQQRSLKLVPQCC